MFYRLLADATVVTHFAFIVYVVFGGFLAWRWPRTILLHISAAGWGLIGIVAGIVCPLTILEDWARREAGLSGLPSEGFIDHYLTGVIYPESLLTEVRIGVLLVVLVSWIGFGVRLRRTSRSSQPAPRTLMPRGRTSDKRGTSRQQGR